MAMYLFNGLAFVVSEVQFDRPGVDVMMTIFCDFFQFSAKKLGKN
jgi:hypothetical protein